MTRITDHGFLKVVISPRTVALALAMLAMLATSLPGRAFAHEGLGLRLEALDRALLEHPDDPTLHLRRVQMLRRAGRLDDASQAIARARQRGLDAPELSLEEAILATSQHHDETAHAAFLQSDASGLSTAESEDARGELLWRGGERRRAAAAFDVSTRLEPTPDRFLKLGKIHLARGAPEAARRALERGLRRLGPAEVLTRALVDLLLARHAFAAALEIIQEQIALRPNNPVWHRVQAKALTGLGRPGRARKARARALALARHAATIRPSLVHTLELARTLRGVGDLRGATEALAEVLARDPNNPDALRLQAALAHARGDSP